MTPITFTLASATVENLYFNGSNTEVEYETAQIGASTSATMEGWFYPTALPEAGDGSDGHTLIEGGGPSSVNYLMAVDSNLEIWIRWFNGSWQNHRWTGTSLNLNAWNHVCGIIKPDVANGCKVYINGVKAGETQNNTNILTNTNNRLRVGITRTGLYPFEGYAKNIIVTTDTDISEAEILQHAANNYSSITSPDVYWKFDETTGTTATDSSGNGYNGVITNGTWQIIS